MSTDNGQQTTDFVHNYYFIILIFNLFAFLVKSQSINSPYDPATL